MYKLLVPVLVALMTLGIGTASVSAAKDLSPAVTQQVDEQLVSNTCWMTYEVFNRARAEGSLAPGVYYLERDRVTFVCPWFLPGFIHQNPGNIPT